jgi:xanthine dehydrogenase YagS FAD-binding subunit
MQPFELVRLPTLPRAQAEVVEDPIHRAYRAGGIDLIDLMKEGVYSPERLVELRRLEDEHGSRMRSIEATETGIRIGALVTLAQLAEPTALAPGHAALAQAAGQAATPGIRNTATVGGNLLQRPRCWYFRAADLVCLKKGGAVCLAVSGDHRYHAILGGGPSYIVHPSSLGSALVALEATVTVQQADGELRTQPIEALFALPSVDPQREHTLGDGEVLLDVTLPAPPAEQRSAYVAAREKQSHDWPLAEAAVRMRIEGGKMTDVRVGLGHVAPVPWRAAEAEKVLEGQKPDPARFAEAATAATSPARPLGGNRYKIPLTQGLLRHALHAASQLPLPE